MRKIIAGFIMVVVVGVYIWSVTREPKVDEEAVQTTVQNASTELLELEQTLLTEYPATAREVMELYNELMKYTYGENIQEEIIPQAISVLRLLYGAEMLATNQYELQVATVIQEKMSGVGDKFYLLSSGIESIEFVDEQTAIIEVIHYMAGIENMKREYYLVLENDQWKVHSWSEQWYDEVYAD